MANEWFSSWLQGPGSTRSSIQRFQRASLGWYLFKRCDFEWFWHRVYNSFVDSGGDYLKFVRFQFHGSFVETKFVLHVGCLLKGDAKEWHSRQYAQPMLGWSSCSSTNPGFAIVSNPNTDMHRETVAVGFTLCEIFCNLRWASPSDRNSWEVVISHCLIGKAKRPPSRLNMFEACFSDGLRFQCRYSGRKVSVVWDGCCGMPRRWRCDPGHQRGVSELPLAVKRAAMPNVLRIQLATQDRFPRTFYNIQTTVVQFSDV